MIEGGLGRLPIKLLVLVGATLVLLIAMGRPPAGPPFANASHGGPWHVVQRVSVASDGTEGNDDSWWPSMSADGRYVAFQSRASNLVPGDTNGTWDVFVHDRMTGQTTRVSVASDGTEGNGVSGLPSISADGRYVAFVSAASNLVPGDTNGKFDVFVHDRVTGQTTRVSVASDGTEGNDDSWWPSISADGRYVAFSSLASNLVPGDTNGTWDVFVHDRLTGQTTRVSVASDGTQGNNGSGDPSISADGRYVAFSSLASNLVPGDTNGTWDVFVHDRLTGQTTRVSVASDGTEGNGVSRRPPSISADGRYVAFYSEASNLVPGDTNELVDVFVHDRLTGQTTRVSVASDGTQGNSYSQWPSISADGRYVAFMSWASNLVPGDTNEVQDIFVHDRMTGQTTRVSVASDGTEGNGDSWLPSISADGRYVAFASEASNLVSGDTNGKRDIFVAAAVEPTAMRLPWGDVNCSGGVDAVDALQLLRYTVRLSVLQQEPCPDIGDTVSVDGTPRLWGDVDGDGEVNAADALKILRHVAMLSVQHQPRTPPIGTEVEVRP
jgi:Tol biopolymer transport system component